MRWVVFAILLYAAVVLQTAVIPFVELHGVRPDLPLLLAVYIGLAAATPDALLAAFIAGLAVDLCDLSFAGGRANVGVNALAYVLVIGLLTRLRAMLFREHASTYLIVAALAALAVHMLAGLHAALATRQWDHWTQTLWSPCFVAAYTALVSPYAYWLLRRARPVMGFGPVRTLRGRA